MSVDLFTNRQPNAEQGERLDKITAAFNEVHSVLQEVLPGGREAALAIQNLEQSSMWAKKSVLFGA